MGVPLEMGPAQAPLRVVVVDLNNFSTFPTLAIGILLLQDLIVIAVLVFSPMLLGQVGGDNAGLAFLKFGVVLSEAVIGAHCQIGPFAHLRPGTQLAEHVHIGAVAVELEDLPAQPARDGTHVHLGLDDHPPTDDV